MYYVFWLTFFSAYSRTVFPKMAEFSKEPHDPLWEPVQVTEFIPDLSQSMCFKILTLVLTVENSSLLLKIAQKRKPIWNQAAFFYTMVDGSMLEVSENPLLMNLSQEYSSLHSITASISFDVSLSNVKLSFCLIDFHSSYG